MRYLLATIVALCLACPGAVAGKIVPAAARRSELTVKLPAPRAALVAHRYVSLNTGKTKRLERIIVRGAQKERWWMLFVGSTLVVYRLFRKHQVLFESSFLSMGYEAPRESASVGAVLRGASSSYIPA